MSDVVRTEPTSILEMTGDPVDIYIARTEELRRIAAEEQASDRLVFAYDARRRAAIDVAQDPGDAAFRLAERRPDLVEQIQADVAAQDVIDTLQRPPASSVVGSGGAQALADARESLEALRRAAAAPESAEDAARARAFLERDMERILPDAAVLYALSKQDPATARGVLAAAYEPAEMDAAALASAARQAERWRAADAQVAAAAERQDPDALAQARRARDLETEQLVRNGLAIYALAQSPTPLSARAELALDAEARALAGAAPGSDAEIDRAMQQALGARAGDPAARYAWLAEEAMAADAGHRRVRLAPRLRARAKAEARGIEAARLDPSLGDRLGVARLAALAKEGRPWLARSFAHDRRPEEPLPAPGTAGRTPDLDGYAAEQAAAGPASPGAHAVAGASAAAAPAAASESGNPARVREVAPGYSAFTAKRLDGNDGSASGLVASVMPMTDAEMSRMLRDPKTPAFALPFAKFSGSKTIDRELHRLYKRDPEQFWSIFEGTRNLSLAILKQPGGVQALSEADRESLDHLQLGLRALAKVAVYENAKEYEARVEEPLQPLMSAKGIAMIERGRRDPAYRAAVRDPDGLIQSGRKDQFTERLAEKGLIPSLKQTVAKVANDINNVAGMGLLRRLSDAFIDEAAR
jgi:hypothetical protein